MANLNKEHRDELQAPRTGKEVLLIPREAWLAALLHDNISASKCSKAIERPSLDLPQWYNFCLTDQPSSPRDILFPPPDIHAAHLSNILHDAVTNVESQIFQNHPAGDERAEFKAHGEEKRWDSLLDKWILSALQSYSLGPEDIDARPFNALKISRVTLPIADSMDDCPGQKSDKRMVAVLTLGLNQTDDDIKDYRRQRTAYSAQACDSILDTLRTDSRSPKKVTILLDFLSPRFDRPPFPPVASQTECDSDNCDTKVLHLDYGDLQRNDMIESDAGMEVLFRKWTFCMNVALYHEDAILEKWPLLDDNPTYEDVALLLNTPNLIGRLVEGGDAHFRVQYSADKVLPRSNPSKEFIGNRRRLSMANVVVLLAVAIILNTIGHMVYVMG